MNIPLLRKVKRAILDNPKFYNQESFAVESKCGTVCCIAGWAVAISYPGRWTSADWRQRIDLAADKSQKPLGLTDQQYHQLCSFASRWPEDLSRRYYAARTKKSKAKIAAERIDRFIESGGTQ